MCGREIAVKIQGVKKRYKLGQIGGGTLQADLQSWWAKVRGKEDPNTKIGENRIAGETFMALNGIDLTIYEGERVGIIGRNGAGKSTLLKLLSRVTAPTEGDIDIYGRITSMLEVGTGFNGEMTGRENIYMNGAILGMTKAEIDSKMEDIIEFSEVRDFIDTPVKRYSSGMFVKLAFSVAAHLDSEIMIMDEVLAVGDMSFQKKCLDKMREVADTEGRTILYVSHNMNTIRRLCDRCIVLDEGKVIYDGDVEKAIDIYLGENREIKKEYQFSSNSHNKFYANNLFRFDSLKLKYTSESRFDCGDVIRAELTIHTEQQWKNVGIRYEIRNNKSIVIGTMFSEQLYEFGIEDGYVLRVDMDTRELPPGRYSVDIVAFKKDSYDNDVFIDGVYPGFVFELSDRINDTNSIKWLHNYWGYTHLLDLKLNSEKKNER